MDETNVLDEMPAEEITQTEKKAAAESIPSPAKTGGAAAKRAKRAWS